MFGYILFLICIISVSSLRLEDFDEGDCRGTRFQPVPAQGLELLNLVYSFKYIPAGSRFDLYYYASPLPRFREMREDELLNTMCSNYNGTAESGQGFGSAFGGQIQASFDFTLQAGQPAVFEYAFFGNNSDGFPLAHATQVVTLTDYKTFVFFANCFTIGSEEHKTWRVLSLTPTLTASTRRLIENHAASLGFNRNNVLFLNNENCDFDANQNHGVSTGHKIGLWGNGAAKRRGFGSAGRSPISGQFAWSK